MRDRFLVIALLAAAAVSVACGEVVPVDVDAATGVDAPTDAAIDACVPVAETCNHVNDDCDGATDEGFDFQRDRQNCGDCNVTCTMLQTCNGSCMALGSITFDESHSNFANYPTFRTQLTTAGYTVRSNTTAPWTAAALQGIQVLVLPIVNNTTAYAVTEIDAIQAAVRGGMGLLLITDISTHHVQAEPIAARFGVSFVADMSITNMTVATHVVTTGVTTLVRDGSAAGLQIDTSSTNLLSVGSTGFMTATPNGAPSTTLGRVIVLTDANMFADFFGGGGNPMANPGNQMLGAQTIAWLAGTR